MNGEASHGSLGQRVSYVAPLRSAVCRLPYIASVVSAKACVNDIDFLRVNGYSRAVAGRSQRIRAGVIYLLPQWIGLRSIYRLEDLPIVIPYPDHIRITGGHGDRANPCAHAPLDGSPDRTCVVGVGRLGVVRPPERDASSQNSARVVGIEHKGRNEKRFLIHGVSDSVENRLPRPLRTVPKLPADVIRAGAAVRAAMNVQVDVFAVENLLIGGVCRATSSITAKHLRRSEEHT